MAIVGLDHVQLAMPAGGEAQARAFYSGLLGMRELEKPPQLAARGGCWFEAPGTQLHLGVEASFAPARKAHPALRVDDLERLRGVLADAGVPQWCYVPARRSAGAPRRPGRALAEWCCA